MPCSGQKWVGQGPADGASPDWLPVAIKEVPYSRGGLQEKANMERVQQGLAHCADSCHVVLPVKGFEGLSVVDGSKALFLITRSTLLLEACNLNAFICTYMPVSLQSCSSTHVESCSIDEHAQGAIFQGLHGVGVPTACFGFFVHFLDFFLGLRVLITVWSLQLHERYKCFISFLSRVPTTAPC